LKEINLKSTKALIIVFGILFLVLILFMPKIYLQNNIYYVSKDINKLNNQYISLKEENKFLKQQHEDALFKNQIMDSLILENLYNQ
jgi:cell division protein FtsL